MENTAPAPSLQAVHWIWLKTPIPRVRIHFKLKHPVEQKEKKNKQFKQRSKRKFLFGKNMPLPSRNRTYEIKVLHDVGLEDFFKIQYYILFVFSEITSISKTFSSFPLS